MIEVLYLGLAMGFILGIAVTLITIACIMDHIEKNNRMRE